MQRLESALHGVDWLSEWSGKFISFFILYMIVALVIDITLRSFHISVIWIHETVQFMYGGTGILAGAYALRHRTHVTMDIIYARLAPRTKAWVDIFSSVFFFLFCGVLLWFSWRVGWRSLQQGEHSYTVWGPVLWPLKMTVPIAAFLILLQGLANFTRSLSIAVTGRELK